VPRDKYRSRGVETFFYYIQTIDLKRNYVSFAGLVTRKMPIPTVHQLTLLSLQEGNTTAILVWWIEVRKQEGTNIGETPTSRSPSKDS